MITSHQPTIFGSSVIAALSSRSDGNMKFSLGEESQVLKNRQAFLRAAGIDIQHTSFIRLTFDTDNYARYRIVKEADKARGMTASSELVEPADALVTDQPGHALFLSLADCVGAIFYDQVHHVLMVSHLGRHSVEIDGAGKSVAYLQKHFATDPPALKVWLSPGVGSASYPLTKFDGKSLHQVIVEQLLGAGVRSDNIESSDIDTAASEQYYSHSEYLKGARAEPGRFAIVAAMNII
jgi:copper oxidase (laccase) domain-containing protein